MLFKCQDLKDLSCFIEFDFSPHIYVKETSLMTRSEKVKSLRKGVDCMSLFSVPAERRKMGEMLARHRSFRPISLVAPNINVLGQCWVNIVKFPYPVPLIKSNLKSSLLSPNMLHYD